MADKSPDFELGEYSRGSMLETVELSAAIGAADVGKFLKATGVNADGQLKCEVQTTNTAPVAVAIKESIGSVGDLVQVLIRGDVKIKATEGAIAAGGALTAKDSKAIAVPTTGATILGGLFSYPVGFARAVFADGDSGLICFSGP